MMAQLRRAGPAARFARRLSGKPAKPLNLEITDPHVHYWAPHTHAWLNAVLPGGEAHDTPYGRFAPVAKPYTPAIHWAHLAPFAPLAKSVYIQANMHTTTGSPVAETAYMQGLADATGHPHGIISWAPLDKPEEAGVVLEQHAKFPNFRGVRFMLDFHPGRPELCQTDSGAYMADDNFLRGLRQLEERGLVFELQVCAVQLEEAAALAAKLPELQMVLNNTGFPLKGEFDSWRAGLAKLAANPNVACKIGGLGAYDGGFDLEAARPHVLACFELFGLERCMFSSNLPVDLVDWPHGPPSARWDTYLEISRGAGLTQAQLGAVFSSNAERIYKLVD
jgi:predicted TIM-barrel fold metal-dependent hydrolase